MHYLFTDPLVEVKSHTGPKRVLVLYMFAKLLPLIDTDKKVLIIYMYLPKHVKFGAKIGVYRNHLVCPYFT